MVGSEFLGSREDLFEVLVRLFGSLRSYYPDAVHNPMDMRVDRDVRGIVENSEDNFCGLDADSWECLDYFQIIGDSPTEFLCDFDPRFPDESCFISVEIDRRDHFFDFREREVPDISWRSYASKKWRRRFIDLSVRRLSREDNCNHELKRRLIVKLGADIWEHLFDSREDMGDLIF